MDQKEGSFCISGWADYNTCPGKYLSMLDKPEQLLRAESSMTTVCNVYKVTLLPSNLLKDNLELVQ